MIKLIKNELYKLVHKKSLYITLIVFALFIFLLNMLTFTFDNSEMYYGENSYKINLNDYDLTNPEELNYYLGDKTNEDIAKLNKENDYEDWQRNIIYEELYDLYFEKNTIEYSNKETEKLSEIDAEINNILSLVNNKNWRYFANKEIKRQQEIITYCGDLVNNCENEKIVASEILAFLNKRLNENIDYDQLYYNNTLDEYANRRGQQLYLLDKKVLTDDEQEELKRINKEVALNKYILENKIDTTNTESLRGILMDFVESFGMLIIIFIVMISGVIVSDEFNKNTIKHLITVPYSRTKILISKLLVSFLVIPFIILFILLIQLIMVSIFDGFSSLNTPVIVYNVATNLVEEINVIKYVFIEVLATLPMFVMLSLITFMFSTLFLNNSLAIILGIMLNFGSELFNALVYAFKVEWLYSFITLNWDFNYYLFGGSKNLIGYSFMTSAIIYILYFVVGILISLIVFKKRDIKNT